jgi:cysteinyl-tRNA synthetase
VVDGKKMSKSLGNLYTVDDVIKKGFDPLALRYLFLGANYRDTLNFTWDSLSAAQTGLERLRSQVASFKSEANRTVLSEEKQKKVDEFRAGFVKALNDDFNTPQALAVLWGMLKSNIPSGDKYDLAMSFDEVLGLKLGKPTEMEIPDEVRELMVRREELRKSGKYKESDSVREEIENAGYLVNDTPAGPQLKKN